MVEQPQPDVRNHGRSEIGVPFSYQIATIEVKMPAAATPTNPHQCLEILLAERIVDQEFQAERHDHVEQRLDQHAEADQRQHLLVVLQERPDETVDRRERAGGFLGGEDDEVLVLLVVLEFVISSSSSSSSSRRGRGLAGMGTRRGPRQTGVCELLVEFRGRKISAAARSDHPDDGGLDAIKPTDTTRPV